MNDATTDLSSLVVVVVYWLDLVIVVWSAAAANYSNRIIDYLFHSDAAVHESLGALF